jgi:hypothetical protein
VGSTTKHESKKTGAAKSEVRGTVHEVGNHRHVEERLKGDN